MNRCLNCNSWKRDASDGIVGVCLKVEQPNERYRFQFEVCERHAAGDERKPFADGNFVKRSPNYSNVCIDPELEAKAVEMLKGGATVKITRKQLNIGQYMMNALVKRHQDALQVGAQVRRKTQSHPLDEHADEIRRLLDAGASYYKIQLVTGYNRQRVKDYVVRKGWFEKESEG